MKFACNPRSNKAASDLLGATDLLVPKPSWLLLDVALLDSKQLRGLIRSLHWTASSALHGSPLERFGEHAPHLVELVGNNASITEGLQRLFAIDSQAPGISLIHCATGLTALQRLCGYLAQSRIDEDLLVHCRFADTRVLPNLLNVLSEAQLARLSVDITSWCWIDHLGEVKCWQHNLNLLGNIQIDSALHLELSAQQFSAMLDASEPDTMFSLLLDNTPELVPEDALGDFRTRLSKILASASTLRLTSPNDRWQFTVLSLSCKEAFHQHPDLQATWKAIELRGTKLVDEMARWSDELWAELQAKHVEDAT